MSVLHIVLWGLHMETVTKDHKEVYPIFKHWLQSHSNGSDESRLQCICIPWQTVYYLISCPGQMVINIIWNKCALSLNASNYMPNQLQFGEDLEECVHLLLKRARGKLIEGFNWKNCICFNISVPIWFKIV